MCLSSDLKVTMEEVGTVPRMMGSQLVGPQRFQLADRVDVTCSVAHVDRPCARGSFEPSTVPRSPNLTRKSIRCPLRILLTACLGVLCTFVTYLCLPDNCADEARSVTSMVTNRMAGRLVHRNINIEKRSIDNMLTEGFWEETVSNHRLYKYCNVVPSGFEGQGISENYKLLQVHMLLSPGQRSLKSPAPALPDARHSCRLDNKANSYPEVWSFMQAAISYKRNQHYKSAFKRFEVYPWGSTCNPGQLLPDGVHQMILLGDFLKDKYIEKFEQVSSGESRSTRVHVVSLPDEVQYQTALAVAHGLMAPTEFQQMGIHKTSENFCRSQVDHSCRCFQTESLKEFVDRAVRSGHYMFKPGHWSASHLLDRINRQNLEMGSVWEISQSLLLRACQGKGFFCQENRNCLDNELFDLVIKESSRHWHNLTKDSVYQSYSKLHAYPFLRQISNPGTDANMVLYSGRLEFVTHVLSALGLKVTQTPPYASRLAFEIFEKKSRLGERKRFLRVLHDGKDITESLPFCQNNLVDGLCKLKFFLHHLDNEVLSHKKTYKEACQS